MIEVIIRVLNSGGGPVTGLTAANIKFRRSPYITGNEISGLAVAEIGSQGNYKISGFTIWQKAKLFINGVVQDWWGEQFTGDPSNYFVDIASAQSVTGAKIFSGNNSHTGNNSFSGANTFSGSNTHSGNNTFSGGNIFSSSNIFTGTAINADPRVITTGILYNSNNPDADNLIWKKYADSAYLAVQANRLVVDAKASADVTGKLYRSIKDAVNYAYNTGSPSSSNRWEILVMPHPEAVYTEDFYWYDYIDIIGIGWVKLRNTLNRSLFIRSGAMTDRNVKAVNLHFENTDMNLNFKMMIADNCSVVMIEDNYSPVLTLEDAQFRNSYFGLIGSGSMVTTGSNRLINCVGGIKAVWGPNDKIYNYTMIDGDYIEQ
jgi:hypothetical protein